MLVRDCGLHNSLEFSHPLEIAYDDDIIPSIKTDHSAIIIELKDADDGVKGPVLWKLN